MTREASSLVIICSKTKRTLLIRRRDSAEFLNIIRGFFDKKLIDIYLSRCTFDEHFKIREICISKNLNKSVRNILLENFHHSYADKLLLRSVFMFNKYKTCISNALLRIPHSKECDWLWPKGSPKKGEDLSLCAIREAYEETGVLVPVSSVDITESIAIDYNFEDGSKFKITYFIATVPLEIRDFRYSKLEVSKIEWVDINTLESKVQVYDKVIPFIKSRLV